MQTKKYYNFILSQKNNGYKTIQVVDQIMNLYPLLYLKYDLNSSEFDELIEEGIKFIDKIYAIVQMFTCLTIPLLKQYNGERGRWKGMSKLFYIY